MIDTVIFDLDGTLLYSLEDLKNSTNYALTQFKYPTKELKEIRSFVGNGVAVLIEKSIPNGLQNPDYEKCLDIFKQHYSAHMLENTVPYDGIIDLLKILRLKHVKTAIVSNKFDKAVKDLCKLYFKDLINVAIGESETTRKKPHPDGVIKAMKELNSNIENTVYVGDSNVDVETAHNSGIKCVGVTWGYRDINNLKTAKADYIINSPEEILNILNLDF